MDSEISFSDEHKDAVAVHFTYEGEKRPFDAIPASFIGKKLETFYLPENKALIVGLGKKEEFKPDYYRRAAAKAVKLAAVYKISGIHFPGQHLSEKDCICLAEGAVLANYAFDKYKSDDAKMSRVKRISFPLYAKKYSEPVHSAALVCRNVHLVRDLVSDNSDVVTPDFL